MRYALAPSRRRLLGLAAFARLSGVHPDLVRRLVTLGLLEPYRDPAGGLWFRPDQVVALARIQRLRMGFGLSYTAAGLVVDLLDRVSELESMLRRSGVQQ